MTELSFDGSFADWKRAARAALAAQQPPGAVRWVDRRLAQAELTLPAAEPAATSTVPDPPAEVRVPREFVALAADVRSHRNAERWALLYRVLWRLTHDEPHLLDIRIDPDLAALHAMAKAVQREIHKMHAFVRFREVTQADGEVWFVAWFEPQHDVTEAAAPFFVDRFHGMKWSILTPDRCAHWDRQTLRFTPGASASDAPPIDAAEDLWRVYYTSIFNPARVKVNAMTSEMPRRFWKNLPEAKAIPHLLASATPRVDGMLASSAARSSGLDAFSPAPVPPTRDLGALRDAAATCRACPLWRNATCTVFGGGPANARIVVVGEQPGDQEDRAGQPFVGPAGQLFDRALQAAGLQRSSLYVTNAVKHFKWTPRGKRRLHQKPNAREIAACRPWLEAELAAVQPELIVCLGSTAAQSVLQTPVRVLETRGQRLPTSFGAPALITVHPSSLLRLPTSADQAAAFDAFVADLKLLAAP
ncbi:MAG TPA: UdgX family uracil-DNA binding protein [Opitutus sp.]|nr:UdgX family uracil-DNA binding protein [Opitutus sp.]